MELILNSNYNIKRFPLIDFRKPVVTNGTRVHEKDDSAEIQSAGPVPIYKKSKKSKSEKRIPIGTKIWLTTCKPVIPGSNSEGQRSCLAILIEIQQDYYILGLYLLSINIVIIIKTRISMYSTSSF